MSDVPHAESVGTPPPPAGAFFEWPVPKQPMPLIHVDVGRLDDGVVLGVFTNAGATFCGLNEGQARDLASLLVAAASPQIVVPDKRLVLPPGA